MKYLVIVTTNHESVLPYHWTEGADRLEWQSPYEGMRVLLERLVSEGHLDRYVGPNDDITRDGVKGTSLTHFNTLEGATLFKAAVERPDITTVEITEVPDVTP